MEFLGHTASLLLRRGGHNRVTHRWLLPSAVALSALLTAYMTCAAPSEDSVRASQLRAAYLLNFARFVDWPASTPPDSLTVCFLGLSAVRGAFIAAAAGKQIGQRSIVVRTLRINEASDACQVLYLEGSPPASSAIRPAVLTIGDLPDFIHKGGIVELFTDDNHLHFKINLATAKHAGLRISANLLQLASRVEDDSP